MPNKKCCGNCQNSRRINFSDIINRHICNDNMKIICINDDSIHRKNKEQKNCKLFERRADTWT